MKIFRAISENHRTVRALGRRNFYAPSEEYAKRNCASNEAGYNVVISSLTAQRRNQSCPASTILTHFRQSVSPSPPLPPTQIPKLHDPILDQPEVDNFKPKYSLSCQVYPSFSFEYFLNPVAPSPFIGPESDGEADEPNVIRADSVKKKRKRKMNKHKLKKLRKRMRRKT